MNKFQTELKNEIIRLTSGAVYLDGQLVSPATDTPTWVLNSMAQFLKDGVKLADKCPEATVKQIAYKLVDSCF